MEHQNYHNATTLLYYSYDNNILHNNMIEQGMGYHKRVWTPNPVGKRELHEEDKIH
jgi:hypothetical protein